MCAIIRGHTQRQTYLCLSFFLPIFLFFFPFVFQNSLTHFSLVASVNYSQSPGIFGIEQSKIIFVLTFTFGY